MAARIEDDFMTVEYDGRVIAAAQYNAHAAADGQGAWIVSGLPCRLFDRNQAITAMVLAERLAAGFADDDPFVIGWRAGSMTDRLIRITTALGDGGVGRRPGHFIPARYELARSRGESGWRRGWCRSRWTG